MSKKRLIGKCPCGCGRNEYDLGIYKGFRLFQKPFFRKNWWISAEKVDPSDLDKLLIESLSLDDKLWDDTARSARPTLREIELNVKNQIDDFWEKKRKIVNQILKGDVVKIVSRVNHFEEEKLSQMVDIKRQMDGWDTGILIAVNGYNKIGLKPDKEKINTDLISEVGWLKGGLDELEERLVKLEKLGLLVWEGMYLAEEGVDKRKWSVTNLAKKIFVGLK